MRPGHHRRFGGRLRTVGKAETGDGRASVDAFLSALGVDARNGTVEMAGRTVQAFGTPGGDGLAYAAGPTVVIGYVVPSDAIAAGLDPSATQEPGRAAFTRIIAEADGKPLADKYFARTGYFRTTDTRGTTATPTRRWSTAQGRRTTSIRTQRHSPATSTSWSRP